MNKIKAFILTCAIFLAAAVIVFLPFVGWIFIAQPSEQENITWGINFSQTQAENLKLDWRNAYLAILEDLGAKNIKLLVDWEKIETTESNYFFDDIDWQVQQAQNHGASIIYVLGMKTGRWPECHVPDWAHAMRLSKAEQQEKVLDYIRQAVQRYEGYSAIVSWQAENEPLVNFGECTWSDKEFLKKEVALIKSLDPTRPVIISDSGENSTWREVAEIGDEVGITLYRKVWAGDSEEFGDGPESGHYKTYALKPVSYWRKAQILRFLFNKKVIVTELQAEPWAFKAYYKTSLEEQQKTMHLEQFKENIAYAKSTGLDTFYFWGTEWWYWLKETQSKPEIWNYAKELF